jgi:hypothetical protein
MSQKIKPPETWTPNAAARYLLKRFGVLVVERSLGGPVGEITRCFGGKPTDTIFRYARRATKQEWDRQSEEWVKYAGVPMPQFESRGEAWIMEKVEQ